jgi:hypothetical protein
MVLAKTIVSSTVQFRWAFSTYADCAIQLTVYVQPNEFHVHFDFTEHSNLELFCQARNQLAWDFIKSTRENVSLIRIDGWCNDVVTSRFHYSADETIVCLINIFLLINPSRHCREQTSRSWEFIQIDGLPMFIECETREVRVGINYAVNCCSTLQVHHLRIVTMICSSSFGRWRRRRTKNYSNESEAKHWMWLGLWEIMIESHVPCFICILRRSKPSSKSIAIKSQL